MDKNLQGIDHLPKNIGKQGNLQSSPKYYSKVTTIESKTMKLLPLWLPAWVKIVDLLEEEEKILSMALFWLKNLERSMVQSRGR